MSAPFSYAPSGTKAAALGNARRLLARSPAAAIEQAEAILEEDADCPHSHRILAKAYRATGRAADSERAERRAIELGWFEPAVSNTIVALAQGDYIAAEARLRPHLQQHSDDPWGLYLMAEIAAAAGNRDAALNLATSAIDNSPLFDRARIFKTTLDRNQILRSAMAELPADRLLQDAISLYAAGLARNAGSAESWVAYGNLLRMIGRRDEAIAALRKAIALNPAFGEAWWALADFKTVAFSSADQQQMEDLLTEGGLEPGSREALHFALARGLEVSEHGDEAFRHYRLGNELAKQRMPAASSELEAFVAASKDLFTANYFSARTGSGSQSDAPIFILGMPRAGSTLLEQILASHSKVEGTSELNDMDVVAAHLQLQVSHPDQTRYLPALARQGREQLENLGKGYLWSTQVRRRTDRPHFIDKMPNNWQHLGLILSILPNAKIIDARRHPLACGWSNYRQRFIRGQEFSLDLHTIGSFYRQYVGMMEHFDALMPGRIYRVYHEALLENPDRQIRELLDYCGLDFEANCIDFHQTRRTVRTSSSEQVRQPLSAAGRSQWKAFEPHLDPLVDALGDVLAAYPYR